MFQPPLPPPNKPSVHLIASQAQCDDCIKDNRAMFVVRANGKIWYMCSPCYNKLYGREAVRPKR